MAENTTERRAMKNSPKKGRKAKLGFYEIRLCMQSAKNVTEIKNSIGRLRFSLRHF